MVFVNIMSWYANLYKEFSHTTMPFSYETHLPCNEVWPTLDSAAPPPAPPLFQEKIIGAAAGGYCYGTRADLEKSVLFFLFSSRMYVDQGDHRRCFEMLIFPAAVSVTSQIAWVRTEREFPLKKKKINDSWPAWVSGQKPWGEKWCGKVFVPLTIWCVNGHHLSRFFLPPLFHFASVACCWQLAFPTNECRYEYYKNTTRLNIVALFEKYIPHLRPSTWTKASFTCTFHVAVGL